LVANFFKRLLAKTIKPIPREESASAGKIHAVSDVPVVARIADSTPPLVGALVATAAAVGTAEGDGVGEGLGAASHCA
jgi:hypothetical protein